jgi:hypothetical protein
MRLLRLATAILCIDSTHDSMLLLRHSPNRNRRPRKRVSRDEEIKAGAELVRCRREIRHRMKEQLRISHEDEQA